MPCFHRTIIVDRIGIPGSKYYIIVSKTGNSVYCVRFQEENIKSTCFYCACTYLLVLCVFCSHSFWTSTVLDVPAGVTQEEGHTGFLIHPLSAVRALILARRMQPFLSLVDREVEFCVLTIQSFSTRWAFLLCTQYYGPIYYVFLRPNCVLLLHTVD